MRNMTLRSPGSPTFRRRRARAYHPSLNVAALFLVCFETHAGKDGLQAAGMTDRPSRVLSVHYEFSTPIIERGETPVRVTIPGCYTRHKTGAPALPFRMGRILLPPGAKIEKVEAQPRADPIILLGTWEPYSGRTGNSRERKVTPGSDMPPGEPSDKSQNRAKTFYPAGQVELGAVHRMAGHDIALIRVFPVRYAPADRRFIFTSRVNVSITVSSSSVGQLLDSARMPRHLEGARDRVAPFVDNPDLLREYRASQPEAITSSTPIFDYLLVTQSSLVPSYQPLVNRKIRDGLAVKTETMESIAARSPGRDPAEKLRNYIRDAYTTWGIRYVLLGGDIATVPCRYAYVSGNPIERDSRVPCDLYFACLDGSWNRDGNDRWGETTDGEAGDDVDLLAEIDVGRAPVDSPAEAAIFVEKTIRHEEHGNPNAGAVLLLATCLEQGAAQGGALLEPLLPYLSQCTLRWLDDRPHTSPQWEATDAIRELNRAPHLVLYSGHGDRDSIMRMSSGDLDALTNQDLFLAYSVGCSPGQFDNDRFSPDSIGEELVKRNRYGAFAAILNARWGWFEPRQEWKYSGEFQVKFFDQLMRKGRVNLGTACQLGRHEMLGQVETSGIMPYRCCYYGITLFGDPHAALQISFPGQETVKTSE